MQLKFFDIPVHQAEEASEDLNRFLRAHRIIHLDKQFLADGANSLWAICVSYVDGGQRPSAGKGSKTDYRAILSAEDFTLFSKLRDLRKRVAAEEGVPIYAVFTNEQLAAMAQTRCGSLDKLAAIEGIGRSKIERHGEVFLTLLREAGASSPESHVDGEVHGA